MGKFCARLRCHLSRFFFLVVFGTVEGQREGTNRFGMMPRREAEDRAGVKSAAQMTTHRDISAQTDAHRLLQHVSELRCVVRIGALRSGKLGSGIVEIPISI